MKLRQRKEYGVDILTSYMERDKKLDVSYEADETTVEPQEAAGEECETDPNHQEEIPIIVSAPAKPEGSVSGTLPHNCHRPEYYGFF